MKIAIRSNGWIHHEALLKKHVLRRISADFCHEGLKIDLRLQESLKTPETYKISRRNGTYVIEGGDALGLYYGIGKFLRTASWSRDAFVPDPPLSVSSPDTPFRAVYFAFHQNNWYQTADRSEIKTYLEELVMYGFNTVILALPGPESDSMEDKIMRDAVDKEREILRLAHELSMRTGIVISCNQGFQSQPARLDSAFSSDRRGVKTVCVSKEGAIPYLHAVWRGKLKQFTDIGLDAVISWQSAFGGCGCPECSPWPENGGIRALKALHEDVEEYYPRAEFIVSTWMLFPDPADADSYGSFSERIGWDLAFASAIIADTREETFPAPYLMSEPVRPLIGFADISMWKRFAWGGFAANPMPAYFENKYREALQTLSGGIVYSEGLYEDAMKVQMAGAFWDRDGSYRDTLREYAEYEFGAGLGEKAVRLMELLERNETALLTNGRQERALSKEARNLSEEIDGAMEEERKNAWRWRVLYDRAMIDDDRFATVTAPLT